MPRYIPNWRNNSFVVELEAAADKLGHDWEDAYVVYAILDPIQRDPEQRYGKGTPFYVGQTNRIGKRILQHYRAARWTPKGGNRVWLRLGTIMYARRVPEFVVLEECGSRLDALKLETVWAQRLLQEGFALTNKYRDQRKLRQPRTVAKDLAGKMKWLTIDEAINASVDFVTSCGTCGIRREVDLRPLRAIKAGPPLRVKDLAYVAGECEICSGKMSIKASDPVERCRADIPSQTDDKESEPCAPNKPEAGQDNTHEFIECWMA